MGYQEALAQEAQAHPWSGLALRKFMLVCGAGEDGVADKVADGEVREALLLQLDSARSALVSSASTGQGSVASQQSLAQVLAPCLPLSPFATHANALPICRCLSRSGI